MGETPDRPPAGTSRTAEKGVRIFDRADRWGAKWLIGLLVVIAVVLLVVALGRGM